MYTYVGSRRASGRQSMHLAPAPPVMEPVDWNAQRTETRKCEKRLVDCGERPTECATLARYGPWRRPTSRRNTSYHLASRLRLGSWRRAMENMKAKFGKLEQGLVLDSLPICRSLTDVVPSPAP